MKLIYKSTTADNKFLVTVGAGEIDRVEGYVTGGASQYFIQFFDNYNVVPTNGVAPFYTVQAIGNDGFTWEFPDTEGNPVFTTGLYVALSSTELTYTAVVDGATFDLELTYETELPAGTSVAGDLTTFRNTLQVWAESAGPKKLYELIIVESLGSACFIVIQATDAQAAFPSKNIIPLAANATVSYRFGAGSGFDPFYYGQVVSSNVTTGGIVNGLITKANTDLTAYKKGCTIYLADAPAGGVAPSNPLTLSASRGLIRAVYKSTLP